MEKSFFGVMSYEEFLREYWQKKVLFIKGAYKNWSPRISEKAILEKAGQDSQMSRLIAYDGEWFVEHGPFEKGEIKDLGETNWTILVQDLEKTEASLESLQDDFSFIPHWRLDDVMVSYATDRGTVGPHLDNYDVFLIQNTGRRLWKLGDQRVEDENWLDGLEVKVLKDYDIAEEIETEPGDLLYIPPRFVHYGTSQGTGSTISVGLHAPNMYDVLLSYVEANRDFLQSKVCPDASIDLQISTSYLSQAMGGVIRQELAKVGQHASQDMSWFLELMAEPRRQWDRKIPEDELENGLYRLALGARLKLMEHGDQVLVFCEGDKFEIPLELKHELVEFAESREIRVDVSRLQEKEPLLKMLNSLFIAGLLVPKP